MFHILDNAFNNREFAIFTWGMLFFSMVLEKRTGKINAEHFHSILQQNHNTNNISYVYLHIQEVM